MAGDINKHLDRAKRFLEKNRVEDAIEAYLSVLDEAPQHQEATQALGDLYARMEQPDRAAVYYGMLFDLLIEPRDENKALAIYNRFLRSGDGAAAAGAHCALRVSAAETESRRRSHRAIQQGRGAVSTAGRERGCAVLPGAHRAARSRKSSAAIAVGGSGGAHLAKNALAARAFLRAGQLATASGANMRMR